MPDLRRKDHTHGERAAGVFISERDPMRQLKRAQNSVLSDLVRVREKLDRTIAIAEKIEEAAKN